MRFVALSRHCALRRCSRKRRDVRRSASAPAAAATDIARRWCPDTRRPECTGTAAGIRRSTSGLCAEQADVLQQQVAEVAGVERLQPLLIGGVELLALAVGEAGVASPARHLVGRQPAVLPAVDHHGEHARGPALLVEVLGFEQLLDQADLVVDVENGEVDLEADQLGMAAQDLDADGVEGAEPGHALDDLADHLADALLHLARGLVGEGDGEDLRRVRARRIAGCGRCGWSARGSCRFPRRPAPAPGRPASRPPRAVRD